MSFYQVVRVFHTDHEERHEAFFETEAEAHAFVEGYDDSLSIIDLITFRCVFGSTAARCEIDRRKAKPSAYTSYT